MVDTHPKFTSSRRGGRARLVLGSLMLLALSACQTPAGVIFPPLADAPKWPPPPDVTRITYVGKLEFDTDLKPAVSGWDAMGQAIFGKKDVRSMLSPLAVCVDSTAAGQVGNRLFVADSNAQTVHVFDLVTRQYATWNPGKGNPPFAQPVAVAWDPLQQRLLVSDSVAAAVLMFDTNGHYLGHLGGPEADRAFQRPVGIAVDTLAAHAGRTLVADAKLHQLLVFSPEGKLVQHVGDRGEGPGQFNYPTYLAIAPSGLIYVSDSLNFRIQQFDPDFQFIRQFGKKGDLPGYFAQPKGVASDSQGHVYVVDSQFENVQLYNDQGQVLMDFGEEGNRAGQFWLPAGICIAPQKFSPAVPGTDRIYVADSYNRRIQVFDYTPVAEDAP